MIKLPRQTGSLVVKQPISLLDVMPTLLRLCGLESPLGLPGRDLTGVLVDPAAQLPPFHVFLEGCIYGGIRKGLLTENYKLVHDVQTDRVVAFDLRDDPWELDGRLVDAFDPDVGELVSELLEWTASSLAVMAEASGGAGHQPAADVRDKLRDMGYVN